MSYYIARTLRMPFEEVIALTTEALKKQGFGIVAQIDVKETLKHR